MWLFTQLKIVWYYQKNSFLRSFFYSQWGFDSKLISFPLYGKVILQEYNIGSSLLSFEPYLWSPTKGYPLDENWTLIWWLLPVCNLMCTKEVSSCIEIRLYSKLAFLTPEKDIEDGSQIF